MANALVVRAWNDVKKNVSKLVKLKPNSRVCIIELGSKYVKSGRVFQGLFPLGDYPNVRFWP